MPLISFWCLFFGFFLYKRQRPGKARLSLKSGGLTESMLAAGMLDRRGKIILYSFAK
jgi:hypothetical protein